MNKIQLTEATQSHDEQKLSSNKKSDGSYIWTAEQLKAYENNWYDTYSGKSAWS